MSTDAHSWDGPLIHPWLHLFGRRWVLEVIAALSGGVLRRSTLAALVPGVSEKVLTETLHELITGGLVERTVIAQVPAEVDYALTARARELWPVLNALDEWARAASEDRNPNHRRGAR